MPIDLKMSEVVKRAGRFPGFFLVMAFCSEAVVQGALIVTRERKDPSE
jgi:hypothetical protein